MARPTSEDAQFARVLDKLVANAPWLTPEERAVVAKRREGLVRAVEAEQKKVDTGRARALSGRKRGG